jgi:G3E family GTPase
MISQLEIANSIIVNKKDLVTQVELEKILCYLKSINAKS